MKGMRGEVLEERVFERKNVSSSKGLRDNCPRLRFKKYNNIWNKKRLNDLGCLVGGGTPSKNIKHYWLGNIPWISSSNLNEDNINLIKITRFITPEAINNSATKLCPKNTINIVSRVGVGKVAISFVPVCTSQDFTNFINKTENNNMFLTYYLSRIMKIEAIKTQGTSIKGITSAEIKKLLIYLPSYEEQKKIANFLTLIDKRIDKQKELINILKEYKKGVLYKVFSKISTYKKLSDISIYKTSSKTVTNFSKNDIGTYPVYDASGIAMYTNKYDMEIDYVSIVKDGSAGRLQYCTAYSSFIGTLGALIAKDCSTYYLYIILQIVDFSKFITGSIIPHIYYRDYKNLILPFPDEIKRKQISNLFKQIDNNIENNNIIIFNLTLYKQGLLQKMFI